MITNKNIRIVVTACVLLSGAYLLQNSSLQDVGTGNSTINGILNTANADVPAPATPQK